jgi:hypothetical protein
VTATKATKGVTALFTRLLDSPRIFDKEQWLSVQSRASSSCERTRCKPEDEFGKPVNNKTNFYCFATLLTTYKDTCFILYVRIKLGQENITASAAVISTVIIKSTTVNNSNSTKSNSSFIYLLN